MLKFLQVLTFLLLLINCKEKNFADDIALVTNSKIEMKFQEFNEGIDEYSSSLIYVGKLKKSIPIKYFRPDIPAPPQIYFVKTEKEKTDSIFFEKLKILYFNGDFKRIIRSKKEVKFDSLTREKLQIIVKNRDTIPHYVIDSTKNIKAYKAFPVFIKNISGKKLKLVVDSFPGIVFLNENKEWQVIRNNSFYICGDSSYNHKFWILEPDEIIVYAVNHLKGDLKVKFKIGLNPTFLSEEFEANIEKKVISKQRGRYILE